MFVVSSRCSECSPTTTLGFSWLKTLFKDWSLLLGRVVQPGVDLPKVFGQALLPQLDVQLRRLAIESTEPLLEKELRDLEGVLRRAGFLAEDDASLALTLPSAFRLDMENLQDEVGTNLLNSLAKPCATLHEVTVRNLEPSLKYAEAPCKVRWVLPEEVSIPAAVTPAQSPSPSSSSARKRPATAGPRPAQRWPRWLSCSSSTASPRRSSTCTRS